MAVVDDEVLEDPEGPGEHDAHLLGEDYEEEQVACPYCKGDVWVFAEQCHHCGRAYEEAAWRETEEVGVGGVFGGVATLALVALLVWAFLRWL